MRGLRLLLLVREGSINLHNYHLELAIILLVNACILAKNDDQTGLLASFMTCMQTTSLPLVYVVISQQCIESIVSNLYL